MPATFDFDLPSSPGCHARPCGVGHRCFLRLTEVAAPKSADGSGVLIGTITAVVQVNLTLWRYTVSVPDEEMAVIPTAGDMQLLLSCLDAESDALLKKLQVLGDDVGRLDVWNCGQPFAPNPVSSVFGLYLATVPRNFAVSHVRLSCSINTGPLDVFITAKIGGDSRLLGEWNWPGSSGNSLLIPFDAWNSLLSSNLMPAGAPIWIDVDATSGGYGAAMINMTIDFLGRWQA